jgi:hypothetical protein
MQPHFLYLALTGASHSYRFTLGERAPPAPITYEVVWANGEDYTIDPRSLRRPARSQLLYGLRHCSSFCTLYIYLTRLSEYRNDGTVVPKELGKGVSAVTVQQVASQRCGAHTATNMEILW